MRHRTTVLLSLFALITVGATGALAASPAPGDDVRDRVASRFLAQASPVADADAETEGLSIAIVAGGRPGTFEFDFSGGPPHAGDGGSVIWSNDTSTTHDLRISVHGTVTSTVEIEPEESFLMHFHTAGNVSFECTIHGEEGDFRVE